MSHLRKITGMAAGLGLFLILLVSVALWLAQTHAFQTRIQARLSRMIPGSLSWTEFSLSLCRGEMNLLGFRLADAGGKTLVDIEELSLDLSWSRLMKKELFIVDIEANGFALNVESTDAEGLNLIAALTHPSAEAEDRDPGTSALPVSIRVGRVALLDGTIDFRMPDRKRMATISGLHIEAVNLEPAALSAQTAIKIETGTFRQDTLEVNFSSLSAEASIDGETVSGLRVQALVNGSSLDLQGCGDDLLTDPVFNLSLKAGFNPDMALSFLKPLALPSGNTLLAIDLKGRPGNPEASASIAFGPGIYRGVAVESLDIRAELKDRVLTLLPSVLTMEPGQVSFSGRADVREAFPGGFLDKTSDPDRIGYEIRLDQDRTDLSILEARIPGMKGFLSSHLTLKGRGVRPGRMSGDLSLTGSSDGLAFHPSVPAMDMVMNLEAGLEGYAVQIRSLDLRSPTDPGKGPSLRGSGQLNMPEWDPTAMTLSANLDFQADNLSGLQSVLPVRADGPVRLTAKVAGKGSVLTARAEATAEGVAAGAADIGRVETILEWSDGLLSIERAGVLNQHSNLDLQGRIRVFKPGTFEMTEPLEMDIIMDQGLVLLEDFLPDARGRVRIQGAVKGSPADFSGRLGISANGLEIYGQSLETVSLQAALNGNRIDIRDLIIEVSPTSGIKGVGRVSPVDRTFDLNLKTTDFDLTDVNALQGRGLRKAFISMDLDIYGTFAAPMARVHLRAADLISEARPDMTGELEAVIRAGTGPGGLPDILASADISRLAVRLEDRILIQAGPADLAYESGALILSDAPIELLPNGRFQGGRLQVRGRLSAEGNLDAQASGDIPLDLARPFVPGMEKADGRLDLKASVAGSLDAPLFQAEMNFNDLTVAMEALDQEVTDISGRIRLDPQAIEITALSGRMGTGRLDLGGRVGIEDGSFKDADLTLNAHQLSLDIPDMMEITLNSRLAFSGSGSKSRLDGDIMVLDGHYYKDVDLFPVSALTRRTRRIEPPTRKQKNTLLEGMGLNIHVGRREPLLVDNNVAYLAVSPDLTVGGTAANPVITGRATIDSGSVNVYKSEFDVQKGVIDFVNPYKTEPIVDIRAEMQVRSWSIFLNVSGPLDNLDLQLVSDPLESHADIISLIAFGKTAREMGTGGGAAGPGRMVSGLLAGKTGRRVQSATGVDQLDIRMGEDDGTGGQAVHVSVGKDLSRQMSVLYDVDTRAGETIQRITTVYRILENLLMSGFQDSAGQMGGEIKYRLEFR